VNGNQNDDTATNSGAAYTFDLAGLSCLQTWRQTWFGNINGAGNEADLADYDYDGMENLMEFGTGGNPLVSAPQPFSLTKNGTTLEFIYPRLKCALEDLTFAVEWSDNMNALSWSTAGVTESIPSDDGTTQLVKAGIPAGTSLRRFVRLRVTRK
jgi:hypothetical protein